MTANLHSPQASCASSLAVRQFSDWQQAGRAHHKAGELRVFGSRFCAPSLVVRLFGPAGQARRPHHKGGELRIFGSRFCAPSLVVRLFWACLVAESAGNERLSGLLRA